MRRSVRRKRHRKERNRRRTSKPCSRARRHRGTRIAQEAKAVRDGLKGCGDEAKVRVITKADRLAAKAAAGTSIAKRGVSVTRKAAAGISIARLGGRECKRWVATSIARLFASVARLKAVSRAKPLKAIAKVVSDVKAVKRLVVKVVSEEAVPAEEVPHNYGLRADRAFKASPEAKPGEGLAGNGRPSGCSPPTNRSSLALYEPV